MDTPRFIDNSERLVTIGRTGTGKTVALLYQLSRRDLKKEKWLILNFKGDTLINSIARAREIDLDWSPPRKGGGLFVVRPQPHERDAVDRMLWRVWEEEDTGVMADEGFMLADSEPYNALLTQGRDKRIPLMTGTQRPVWMSRFVFSEASFFQLFDLSDRRDWLTVEAFMPRVMNVPLEKHWSWYYDVAAKRLFRFTPVPPPKEILANLDAQLTTRQI